MNKLLRPKNALKVSSVFLYNEPTFNGTMLLQTKKSRFYMVVGKEGTSYINVTGKEEKLSKNQIVVIGPNSRCIIKPNDSEVYKIIGFEGSIKSSRIINKIINLSALSGSIYKELILKFENKEAFKEREIALIISTLEYLLNTLINQQSTTKIKSDDYGIFTEAVRHIKENLDKDISINNMASYLCVSSSKLKRVFAKYSALSIHKFMLAVKIEKAKEMLSSGLASKEVSKRLGFENQNYFSAVFKRETGKSPSNYHKAIIENIE